MHRTGAVTAEVSLVQSGMTIAMMDVWGKADITNIP